MQYMKDVFKYAGILVVAVLALGAVNSWTSPDAAPALTTDSAFSEPTALEDYGYEVMAELQSVDRGEAIKHTDVTNPQQTLGVQAYDNAALHYIGEMDRKAAEFWDSLETVDANFHVDGLGSGIAYHAGLLHDENDHFFTMTHGGVPEERQALHAMLTAAGEASERAAAVFYNGYTTGDYGRFLDGATPMVEAETLRTQAMDEMYAGGEQP